MGSTPSHRPTACRKLPLVFGARPATKGTSQVRPAVRHNLRYKQYTMSMHGILIAALAFCLPAMREALAINRYGSMVHRLL